MAKKNANANLPVEEKLKNLNELQIVNSKLDNIKKLQGELNEIDGKFKNEVEKISKNMKIKPAFISLLEHSETA